MDILKSIRLALIFRVSARQSPDEDRAGLGARVVLCLCGTSGALFDDRARKRRDRTYQIPGRPMAYAAACAMIALNEAISIGFTR
jgi:hypothetical protein